jgi:virginiamycin B lyase
MSCHSSVRVTANVLRLSVLLLIPADLSLAQSSTLNFTEYVIPTPSSRPYGITAGPDGALWFTEYNGNKIGRITTAGTITEYAVPTPSGGPWGITAGPDGALWFTEACGNKIGRITVDGAISEYPTPFPYTAPMGIVVGPDGAMWFTEYGTPDCILTGTPGIGRITSTGSITNEYALNGGDEPIGITAGPDGALWFSMFNEVGRITTAGALTRYRPTGASWSSWITVGPDGALWFTSQDLIGRITTSGSWTTYTPTTNCCSFPEVITAVPDGRLWFADAGTASIGRISTSGYVVEYPVPTNYSGPYGITLGPDGALWFTEYDGNRIGTVPVLGNGVDVSRASGDVADSVWQNMVDQGIRIVVVQGWGGSTQSPFAKDQLVGDGTATKGAQNSGLSTAAYTLLNYSGNETGSYQVDQAIAAVGPGVSNLKFIAVDVESCCGELFTVPATWKPSHSYSKSAEITDSAKHIQQVTKAGISGSTVPIWNDSGGNTTDGTVTWKDLGKTNVIDQTARVQLISDAVSEIKRNGLKAVIYTDRGSWTEITGGCGTGKTNNCSNLISLPLWDVEHRPKQCGDEIAGLLPFTPYSALSWQTRSGNQYDFGNLPSCNGNALFGITVDDVDLDFLDPALFM